MYKAKVPQSLKASGSQVSNAHISNHNATGGLLCLSHTYLNCKLKVITLFHKHSIRVSVDDWRLIVDVSHSNLQQRGAWLTRCVTGLQSRRIQRSDLTIQKSLAFHVNYTCTWLHIKIW